jgi:hypothetical protein
MAETKAVSTTEPPKASTRTEGETAPTGTPLVTPTQAECDMIVTSGMGADPGSPPPEGSIDYQVYQARKKAFDEAKAAREKADKERIERDKKRREMRAGASALPYLTR